MTRAPHHDPCWYPLSLPSGSSLPGAFTYPFNYAPHPLTRIAAADLQARLTNNRLSCAADGKMLGVLLVRDQEGRIGYLAAFSGELEGRVTWPGFVPPLYDYTRADGFFKQEEAAISAHTRELEALLAEPSLPVAGKRLEAARVAGAEHLAEQKRALKAAKAERARIRREERSRLDPEAYAVLEARQHKERLALQYSYKRAAKEIQKRLKHLEADLRPQRERIWLLQRERKERSLALQEWLFDQYVLLNARGESSPLRTLFEGLPPAGAGDCAGPRLLQYAYQQGYAPLAMAEFWWGAPSPSAVRLPGRFYPACRSRCLPILSFMMRGLVVDPDPTQVNLGEGKEISIIFEDEAIAVVDKPEGLLSEPGISITDSVLTRMRARYPETDSPLLVHRLDMATSGLLVIGKTREAHRNLQQQFEKRRVAKRYVALLDGIPEGEGGLIDLPLRPDLDNRPQQMVCHAHGKAARTEWRLVAVEGERARVCFSLLTGRTHQLRVHAAHPAGLGVPIVGDALYGERGSRLCLHAAELEFDHPVTGERVAFSSPIPF